MLRKGVLDGFCVGAPWGQDATLSGAGRILFSDPAYWGLKPEKVLGGFRLGEMDVDLLHVAPRADQLEQTPGLAEVLEPLVDPTRQHRDQVPAEHPAGPGDEPGGHAAAAA